MPTKLEQMTKGLKRATGPSEVWEYETEAGKAAREDRLAKNPPPSRYEGKTGTERRGRWGVEQQRRGLSEEGSYQHYGPDGEPWLAQGLEIEKDPTEYRRTKLGLKYGRRWNDKAERDYKSRGSSR